MWLLYAFGSAFFAGITAILAKIGIRNTDSHLTTALRTIIILAFSWLMVFLTGVQGGIFHISRFTLIFLCLSGLTTGASWLCYFKALQIGDINKVVPIDKSSTILTMILALIFLGEKLTVLKAAAIVLIGVGTYFMIEKKQGQNSAAKGPWLFYAALSAVFASLTAILGKIGIQDIDSNLGTAIRTVVVLVMAWLIVFKQGKHKEIRKIDRKSWLFISFSGLSTGLSWLCYYRALQEGDAGVVVPIDKLSILVTVLFAYLVFKEKLSAKSLIGLILIVGGTLSLLL